MADRASSLATGNDSALGAAEEGHSTGILPAQAIREAIGRGLILADEPIGEDQIQPASLDLRLGDVAYRVQASFLPGRGASVQDKLDGLSMHRIDLTPGAVLEQGCVYIVPLRERLKLRKRISAVANPKSSTGRLDIFARIITDEAIEFDQVREGYAGPLWAEISPRSFSVLVGAGARLVQLRLKQGSPRGGESALRRLHEEVKLIEGAAEEVQIRGRSLAITLDVAGCGPDDIIGYRAKKHTPLIDIARIDHYEPLEFWEPVRPGPAGGIILDPDDFYILASKESVKVPPDHAAEMIAYDTLVGEFRVHYAGFFDPGFGHAEGGGAGSRAVLEVRSHDVPFLVEDGQVVGWLVYERLTARPDKLYGTSIGSSYQQQRLALSKQFKRPPGP